MAHVRTKTDYIVIHCSATPPSMKVDVKEIDRWHRLKGWLKIGYHFVITRDGVLQKGRDLDEIGAHVHNYNHKSVGICMVGGVREREGWPNETEPPAENNFTPEQWKVLEAIVTELHGLYPDAKIVGHRDLDSKKECPSFDVAGWLESLTPKVA
jgi:N-acetylmuramoyl-L-alanine amidase